MYGPLKAKQMLNPDYQDILSGLSNANVQFIVVGAYALTAHGFPRATGDIDIFVRSSVENSSKLLKALIQFGVPLDNIKELE